MDKKNLQILKAIAEEKTNSPEKIHEKTGIPTSTVHYRLDELREEGVIKNDLMQMDLAKLGLELTLISEVYAEYGEGYHETVGEKLAEIEGVNKVYFTMGDTDFVIVAHVPGREMVESLIEDYEAIDEISRTSSKFVITTVKDGSHRLDDFGFDTLAESLL